jgi:hypothetical protein
MPVWHHPHDDNKQSNPHPETKGRHGDAPKSTGTVGDRLIALIATHQTNSPRAASQQAANNESLHPVGPPFVPRSVRVATLNLASPQAPSGYDRLSEVAAVPRKFQDRWPVSEPKHAATPFEWRGMFDTKSSGELIQKPRAPSGFLISSVRKPSADIESWYALQSVAIGHRDPKSFPGPIAVSPGPASLFLPVIEITKNSKAAVLQGFLAFIASGSLFFSKITLILAQ